MQVADAKPSAPVTARGVGMWCRASQNVFYKEIMSCLVNIQLLTGTSPLLWFAGAKAVLRTERSSRPGAVPERRTAPAGLSLSRLVPRAAQAFWAAPCSPTHTQGCREAPGLSEQAGFEPKRSSAQGGAKKPCA